MLSALLLALLAAAGHAHAGCPLAHKPVCAQAISFQNECLAATAGHAAFTQGMCTGTRVRFMSQEASSSVHESVMKAFAEEGFAYVGRTQLAQSHTQPAATSGGREAAAAHARRGPSDVPIAWRFTKDGSLYAKSIVEAAADGQGTTVDYHAPVVPTGLSVAPVPSVPSDNMVAPPTRRLLGAQAIIGTDERVICPRTKFPYSAVGQLDFSNAAGSSFICSGALFKNDRVITAAHCTWDDSAEAFVSGVAFAPGRYLDTTGALVNPYGTAGWSYITTMNEYKTSGGSAGDMAVIRIDAPMGAKTGTLGLKVVCDGSATQVIISGYPADQPVGTCMVSTCMAKVACAADSTNHECDTYPGMSGSAAYDSDFNVRGTHVRALGGSYNQFTTLTAADYKLVMSW